MTNVLNGPVKRGDLIAYSVRKHWDMATRIGVVVRIVPEAYDQGALLVRVVRSSDGHVPDQMVWITELNRVVKLRGGIQ